VTKANILDILLITIMSRYTNMSQLYVCSPLPMSGVLTSINVTSRTLHVTILAVTSAGRLITNRLEFARRMFQLPLQVKN